MATNDLTPITTGLLAAAFLCAMSGAMPGAMACAAEILPVTDPVMGCTLSLSGPLAGEDADRLGQVAAANTTTHHRLCLDSPGGAFADTGRLAEVLARLGAGTAIAAGATCQGACALVFMAGQGAPLPGRSDRHPERLLHPQGRLGLHAPRLSVPDGAGDQGALDRAYGAALSGIGEILRLRRRHGVHWPDSLLLTLLDTPPRATTYVQSVGQAARWQIQVAPVALPNDAPASALTHACLNAEGALRDSPPEGAIWYGRVLAFAYGGFDQGSADLTTSGGFGPDEEAPCSLRLQASGPLSDIGVALIGDDGAGQPARARLFPYALYDPATPIASLPPPSPEDSGAEAFFASLASGARRALSDVRFDSCWLRRPEAKVVNVESYVNLRSAPGFEAEILREAPLGERLRVLGTQMLHTPGDAARAETCRDACNRQVLDRENPDAAATAGRCISGNVFWYEVQDQTGQTGFISRKYLSD